MDILETAALMRDRLADEGNREVSHDEAREMMNLPSGQRPRLYGLLATGEGAGQIVKLASQYHLDKYDCALMWTPTSERTIADLIRRA